MVKEISLYFDGSKAGCHWKCALFLECRQAWPCFLHAGQSVAGHFEDTGSSGMLHTRNKVVGRRPLWPISGSTDRRLRHIILECFIRYIKWLGDNHCGRVVAPPTNGCDTSFWNDSYEILSGWATATVAEWWIHQPTATTRQYGRDTGLTQSLLKLSREPQQYPQLLPATCLICRDSSYKFRPGLWYQRYVCHAKPTACLGSGTRWSTTQWPVWTKPNFK
jgi:hypothetical protein